MSVKPKLKDPGYLSYELPDCEITIEPLFYGAFVVAVYDLTNRSLNKPKNRCENLTEAFKVVDKLIEKYNVQN